MHAVHKHNSVHRSTTSVQRTLATLFLYSFNNHYLTQFVVQWLYRGSQHPSLKKNHNRLQMQTTRGHQPSQSHPTPNRGCASCGTCPPILSPGRQHPLQSLKVAVEDPRVKYSTFVAGTLLCSSSFLIFLHSLTAAATIHAAIAAAAIAAAIAGCHMGAWCALCAAVCRVWVLRAISAVLAAAVMLQLCGCLQA